METQVIKINDKEYLAYVARTEEEKEKGLQGVTALETVDGREEGMLFVYDEPQHLGFWMKDTDIELSIIFIDDEGVVISNKLGIPNTEDLISEDYAQYVFECNPNTEIQAGDKTSLGETEDFQNLEVNKLYIFDASGNVQGTLEGGERIFSRKSSRVIIRKAKRAFKSKSDADYKSLGRYVFNEMDAQDNREPEYV